jgi:CheY-like chemotaxis protein
MPKILLVEHNEMNRNMLSRRLKRKGHDLVIATDGQQGIDRARADGADLILMDMSLRDDYDTKPMKWTRPLEKIQIFVGCAPRSGSLR